MWQAAQAANGALEERLAQAKVECDGQAAALSSQLAEAEQRAAAASEGNELALGEINRVQQQLSEALDNFAVQSVGGMAWCHHRQEMAPNLLVAFGSVSDVAGYRWRASCSEF